MAGTDLAGTASAQTVVQITGAAGTVAMVANTFSWASGNANFKFGATTRAVIEAAHGHGQFGDGATDCAAFLGPLTGNETTNCALWLNTPGVSRTSGNCAMYADSAVTWVNGKTPSGSVRLSTGGSNSLFAVDGASGGSIGCSVPFGGNAFATIAAFQWKLAAKILGADTNYTAVAADYTCPVLSVTSSLPLTGTRNFVLPVTAGAMFYVFNGTTGAQALQFIGTSGTGITVANAKRAVIYCDGTNYVRVTADV